MGRRLEAAFTVDRINGFLGHELKYDNQKMVSNYLRVGSIPKGRGVLQAPAGLSSGREGAAEDDLRAQVVVPRES